MSQVVERGARHEDRPAAAVVQPGRRRQRGARRLLLTVVGVIALATVGLSSLLLLTPGVGDAEQRVGYAAHMHGVTDAPAASGSEKVEAALVATEDRRFFSHHGIDSLGLVRAGVGLFRSEGDQGGSTLEQQLTKLLYSDGRRGVADKANQVALALKFDQRYSKSQVLEMYLATAYFGNGNYGLRSAAEGYFGRSPAQLSWAQASMLAGLVQAPSAYDPVQHYALAKSRQRHVLDRLVAVKALSQTDADRTFAAPLNLR